MIVLNRQGDGSDIRAIRQRTVEVLRAGGKAPMFVILPGGHRPKRKYIEAAQRYLRAGGVEDVSWLQHTLIDWPGGMGALLQGLPGDTAFVEVLSTFDQWPRGRGGYRCMPATYSSSAR